MCLTNSVHMTTQVWKLYASEIVDEQRDTMSISDVLVLLKATTIFGRRSYT